MFTKGNKVYADAGKYLIYKNITAYQINANIEDVEERDIDLNNIYIKGPFVYISGIKFFNNPNYNYGQWKSYIVKTRYSLDDQIAIMLNKDNSDDDMFIYNKMQEWREWASTLASILISINTKK